MVAVWVHAGQRLHDLWDATPAQVALVADAVGARRETGGVAGLLRLPGVRVGARVGDG